MTGIRSLERGFTTIMALFLLLVLTAMGGYMLTFSKTQQLTSAMGYVIRQPIATAACPASPTNLPGGTAVFDGGFTVVLTCTMQAFTEGLPIAKNKKLFFFTSVATNANQPGNVGFVERSLSGSVNK